MRTRLSRWVVFGRMYVSVERIGPTVGRLPAEGVGGQLRRSCTAPERGKRGLLLACRKRPDYLLHVGARSLRIVVYDVVTLGIDEASAGAHEEVGGDERQMSTDAQEPRKELYRE